MILDVGWWWLTMNRNVHEYYQTYDQCQWISNLLTHTLVKLVTTLPKEPFQKWGLNFIRPFQLVSKMLSNWYFLVANDYATKWVKTWALCTNIVTITTKFLYEHIFLWNLDVC
jgi:hypothetical protein